MWKQEYSLTVNGLSRNEVWEAWTDVNRWPMWHEDLESCELQGSFSVGNSFKLKPKGMRAVNIDLTEIHDGYSFTDCTKFLGAKMFDTHSLEDTPEGLKMTNKLIVTGPMSFIWIRLVAKHIAEAVSAEMEALVQYIRGNHGKR